LCYVFGTWVFGKGHPALHLLLLIAIAFDILGLLGIAVTSLSPHTKAWRPSFSA
jgi:hypothetical protein